MIVDYNSIHEPEYAKINERISPNLKLYLNRLKQHVPNINIRLYGSITNFTHFKNKSDVDCYITYPDEYTKNKLIQFVTEDSLQFKIKRINVQQLKFSSPNYRDEFADVYCVYFDNGDKVDFTLIYGDLGPVIKLQNHIGIIYIFLLYIIKWLYYYANIISKDLFIYLKKKMFVVKDYFSNMTVTVLHKTNIKVSDSDSS